MSPKFRGGVQRWRKMAIPQFGTSNDRPRETWHKLRQWHELKNGET